MKVLHVFPSFAVGGAEVRFAALANRFGARWQHMLVALDGRTDCALRISPDVPFTLVPSPVQKGEGPAGLLRIRTALRQLAPAVLVTSNWGSIEWAAAARTIPGLRHLMGLAEVGWDGLVAGAAVLALCLLWLELLRLALRSSASSRHRPEGFAP